MKKISIGEYTNFVMAYAAEDFPHQRFGQAFMNYYYTNTSLHDPDLFYCINRELAAEIIFAKYIDLEIVS